MEVAGAGTTPGGRKETVLEAAGATTTLGGGTEAVADGAKRTGAVGVALAGTKATGAAAGC
jgi:hypothetical protein